jgi:hypothetical protein
MKSRYGYSDGFFNLAGSDNTYRVKIKATVDVTIFFVRFPFETEKTITVTVIEKLRIATAANFSTLEKTQKIIPLTTNKDGKENEVSFAQDSWLRLQ